jgi:hypothetical protein
MSNRWQVAAGKPKSAAAEPLLPLSARQLHAAGDGLQPRMTHTRPRVINAWNRFRDVNLVATSFSSRAA